jgi:hypothetical protein
VKTFATVEDLGVSLIATSDIPDRKGGVWGSISRFDLEKTARRARARAREMRGGGVRPVFKLLASNMKMSAILYVKKRVQKSTFYRYSSFCLQGLETGRTFLRTFVDTRGMGNRSHFAIAAWSVLETVSVSVMGI